MQARTTIRCMVVAVAVLMLVPAARADWNTGDPYKMHYPQMPDLQTGMNIRDNEPMVLADDWRCTESGLVKDIHIWGSWWRDIAFGFHVFQMSIWSDNPDPDGPGPAYSTPGQMLWERWFDRSQYSGRAWYQHDPDNPEPFFDPNENAVIGTDTVIWQYNFVMDEDPGAAPLFRQEEGKIYWLAMTVWEYEAAIFGWKTADRHFNDDAVWGDIGGGHPTGWHELVDPATGRSLDLAFVITPEPATLALMGLGLAGAIVSRRRSRRKAE